MNARNRMADVVKLRCNACQDFLKMIMKEGWQKELYKKAKDEVTNETRFKDKYIATYEKMRNSEDGITRYSIDDMDVTLITELVVAHFMGIFVDKETLNALKEVKNDRNLKDHSNENEEADELYLRGLLALCNLRDFVRIVDKKEVAIDDNKRLAYRQKYIPKIEELKDLLDEERIELVQKKKSMRKDIQRVLDSDDPLRTWVQVSELYMDRYFKFERNDQAYHEFMVCASDAGVVYAHYGAASYFLFIAKDYVEMERKLFLIYNSVDYSGGNYAHDIISTINMYLMLGNEITEGMQEIIDGLVQRGFNIKKNDHGFSLLSSKS